MKSHEKTRHSAWEAFLTSKTNVYYYSEFDKTRNEAFESKWRNMEQRFEEMYLKIAADPSVDYTFVLKNLLNEEEALLLQEPKANFEVLEKAYKRVWAEVEQIKREINAKLQREAL